MEEEKEALKLAAEHGRQDVDKGNEEYAKGNYEEACKSWSRSLQSAKYILDKGLYKDNEEQLKEVYAIQLRLRLNMAQGNLKMGNLRDAVKYADQALEHDPVSTKALYRKASALNQLSRYGEAIAVLETLRKLEPENPAAKSLLAESRRSAALSDRKAKRTAKKMFSLVSSERDPRVPPSRKEVLIELLQTAPRDAWQFLLGLPEYLLGLPRAALELLLVPYYSARRSLRSTARRARRRLEALGLLRGRSGGGSSGAETEAAAPAADGGGAGKKED